MLAKPINNFIKANTGSYKGNAGNDTGSFTGSNNGGSNPQE